MSERRQVLIVDDEPGMRYMARRVFQDRFDILEAEDGESALRILEERTCHFAVVDVRLPGISGLELLTRIHLLRPEIDVIVMTGSAADPDEVLEDSIRRKAFFFLRKPFPISVLETLADRIVESQEAREALDRQMRRLQRDLDAAKKFQRRLLPPSEWENRGVRVSSLHIASERLSGDFFDYWRLPGGEVAVLVADVMGHGPSAAMATGIVKSQLQRSLAESPDPAEALVQLELELGRSQISGFLTAFLLVVHDEEIAYCGAGHPAVLGWTRQGSRFALDSSGIPINTGFSQPARSTERLSRRAGDRLVLLTDGYTEGANGSDEMFGESPEEGAPSPLESSMIAACEGRTLPEALAEFDRAWIRYTGSAESEDDRAVIVMEFVSP
jgi:serine phosphatase RsbU (regulator of sigma subunit)